MAYGKSFIITFLVAMTLSSMSVSLGARHLLHTTGQWSTPNALPTSNLIGTLGPRPNMYYWTYYDPIHRTSIPGYTLFPRASTPDSPPHPLKSGLYPHASTPDSPPRPFKNGLYPQASTPDSPPRPFKNGLYPLTSTIDSSLHPFKNDLYPQASTPDSPPRPFKNGLYPRASMPNSLLRPGKNGLYPLTP